MEEQEKEFYALLTIYGALAGIGPYIIFEASGTWSFVAGCVLTIFGFGGLLMLLPSRQRVQQRLVGTVGNWAGRLPSLKFMAVVGVWILIGTLVYILHELRSELDIYVTPRTVSADQAERIKKYLSDLTPGLVSVVVVPRDDEAQTYANQLWAALRETKWEVNPPKHDGPQWNYRPDQPPQRLDAKGKPIFPSNEDYLLAHAKWIDTVNQELLFESTGLTIVVRGDESHLLQDPQRPLPEQVMQAALSDANINVNGSGSCDNVEIQRDKIIVCLVVGHRLRQIGYGYDRQPLSFKVARWIEEKFR